MGWSQVYDPKVWTNEKVIGLIHKYNPGWSLWQIIEALACRKKALDWHHSIFRKVVFRRELVQGAKAKTMEFLFPLG